jgi:hypothetical protein
VGGSSLFVNQELAALGVEAVEDCAVPQPIDGKREEANEGGQADGAGDFEGQMGGVAQVLGVEYEAIPQGAEGHKHQDKYHEDHAADSAFLAFGKVYFILQRKEFGGGFPHGQGFQEADLFLSLAHNMSVLLTWL